MKEKHGMATLTRKALAAAVALAAALSLAACGTSDDSDSSASGSDSASGSTSKLQEFDTSGIKKNEKIAAMLPDSITKDGILLNGADTTYAPDAFIDEDGKTPVGYDIDLTKALAAVFGLKPKVVTSTLDTIIPSVGTKYDLGISALTVSKEREEAVDFVTYFQAGMTYAVQKGNPKKVDTSDLCGVKVAVQTGSTEETDINKMAEDCAAAGKSKMEIFSYDQQTDVTTAVVTGKAAIFYADTPVTNYAIKQTGDELETLGEDVDVKPQAIAVKKGDTQTAQAVKLALEELMKDGTYDKIMQKWGIESGAIDTPEINPVIED